MRKKVLLVSVLIFTALCSFAQTSDMGFSFQGYAIDPDGKALAGTKVTVRFSITPGTFTEEHEVKTDAFGVFHAIIGNSSENKKEEFAKINFAKKVKTLKVEVKETSGGTYQTISNAPMKAVPYARFASNGVPVGTIVAFGGDKNNVPKGWLLCDGSSVLQDEYKQLYKAIGGAWGESGSSFNLPDLRGRFLRGVDGGSGNDPDAGFRTASNSGGNTNDKVGTLQDDAFVKHNHDATCEKAGAHTHNFKVYNANLDHDGGATEGSPRDDGDGAYYDNGLVLPAGEHDHVINIHDRGGNETRPKNAAVYYIIKY